MAPKDAKLHMDWTISVGNLLTIGALIISIIIYSTTIETRFIKYTGDIETNASSIARGFVERDIDREDIKIALRDITVQLIEINKRAFK